LTAFVIAGVVLVVLGLLAVLFVRWRKSRSDRAYFDALANEPYASSGRPEQPAFTMVDDSKMDGPAVAGFAVTSLEPREPSPSPLGAPVNDAPAPPTPAPSEPVAIPEPEASGSASQAADDAMAELDRLLGNNSD